MIATADTNHEDLLKRRLERLTEFDTDYWSFRGNSKREHGHGLFPYPAMMVPQMVRSVLSEIRETDPTTKKIIDPFVGSGTVLTETMMAGLSFSGNDINPLAVLLCKVKSGPFFTSALPEKAAILKSRIHFDTKERVEINFVGLEKWFRKDIQLALSKIRRGIRMEESLWARRFFWIALAEVARLTSNSRTSTFKLHTKAAADIVARTWNPLRLFEKIISRNILHLKGQADKFAETGLISKGHYKFDAEVILGDTRKVAPRGKADAIITSPPYGDNATTVPYGQYSFLPLQWIDFSDIDPLADTDALRTTHQIDSMSLGGKHAMDEAGRETLLDRSLSLRSYIDMLKDEPRDRSRRVERFIFDLDQCLPPILKRLKSSGTMVWTLGNRKVGGHRLPLDLILGELLEGHGARLVCSLNRKIPGKRMASRNSHAETMTSESILVMRKEADND